MFRCQAGDSPRQRFTELDDLSTTDRVQLAQRIGEADAHPTIGDLIRQVEHQMVCEQPEAGPRPVKRPRTNEYPTASSDSASLIADEAQGRGVDSSAIQADTDNPSAEEGEPVAGACIQGVVNIFPEYLSDAIRRDGVGDKRRAAVTISFPGKPFGVVACIMTLAVRPNKVDRLAHLLFGAHLETEGQNREVVLESGCRILVLPKVVIQGCRTATISKVFGPVIAEAIAAAPYRKQEVLDGVSATRCVTMTIYSDERGAEISLSLGLKEGSRIDEMLQ
ncbi:hypothetical protein CDV31_001287 [Fusarium ambrosium]|uniref:Uncharacterized protein n=1 Tax=Fusarium ambrosium TaxID=131363 RepID=A0A428V0B5_9HYPO|nr:hypothetical protein CDV31_001287 [Fusarium ambrosium]